MNELSSSRKTRVPGTANNTASLQLAQVGTAPGVRAVMLFASCQCLEHTQTTMQELQRGLLAYVLSHDDEG